MSEEILFEIPKVRITTEHIAFDNAAFEFGYIASTDIDEKLTVWGNVSFWGILLLIASGVSTMAALHWLLPYAYFFCCFAMLDFVRKRLPKKYVLTITMTDKMFYEVITQTREEAEIIQRHINEAMKHESRKE